MIDREHLKGALSESFAKSIAENAASALNYGTKDLGAFMLGHPAFLEALSGFLSAEYGQEVPAANLMSTGGASMATDIACRVHAAYGDCVVSEAPTYYLGHNMFRERGLRLREVPIQPDGMDLDALEEVLKEEEGKVKMVYTIPVHHNPTGITMCNEKRARLVALAKQYDFKILADEAYQFVSFTDPGVVSLHFHDDAADPRVLSIGTFSKLIGPGIKVGWVHAHPELLKPMSGIGFIDSGNNPVIFNSSGLAHFISSGALKEHITFVNAELGRKKDCLVAALTDVGLEPYNPNGGYFVWVKSKGKMTGRSGKGMTLDPPNQFEDYMRLCFAWLTDEQIKVGVEAGLRQE
jgi:DNA-binding transcriptional MocR family regulator